MPMAVVVSTGACGDRTGHGLLTGGGRVGPGQGRPTHRNTSFFGWGRSASRPPEALGGRAHRKQARGIFCKQEKEKRITARPALSPPPQPGAGSELYLR